MYNTYGPDTEMRYALPNKVRNGEEEKKMRQRIRDRLPEKRRYIVQVKLIVIPPVYNACLWDRKPNHIAEPSRP